MSNILFCNTLLMGVIISILFLFVHLISPIMNNKYQASWRFNIWKVLSFLLVVPMGLFFRFLQNSKMGHESIKFIQSTAQTVHTEANPALVFQSISENLQTSVWTRLIDAWPQWLPGILVAGVFVFAVYFMVIYTFFRRDIKKNSNIICSSIIEEIQIDFFKNRKKRRPLPVYVNNKISSPMIVGILKPVIFIPQREYTRKELKIILTHELTHYVRHDLLYKALSLVALVTHWYNPFVHMMMKTMDRDMEICCDQDVVRGKDHEFKSDYSDVIMSEIVNAKQRKVFLACMGCDKAVIAERFKNIFIQTKHKGKYCFVLALLIALLVSNFVYATDKSFSDFVDTPEYNQLLDSVVAKKLEVMKAKLEKPHREEDYEYIPNYLELCEKYADEDGILSPEAVDALYKEAGLPPPERIEFDPKSVETSYNIMNDSIEPHVMANGERALYCDEAGDPWKLKKGDLIKLHVFSDAVRFGSKGLILFGYYKDEEYTQIGEVYSKKGEEILTIEIPENGEYNFYLFDASSEPIVIKWVNIDL